MAYLCDVNSNSNMTWSFSPIKSIDTIGVLLADKTLPRATAEKR